MKNIRAQALIEFVLILPILIMLLFSIIDFGNIYITKVSLEGAMDSAYEVLKSSTDTLTLKDDINKVVNGDSNGDIKVRLEFSDDYATLRLEEEVTIITPGLGLVVGSPYKAVTERVIKYVKQ